MKRTILFPTDFSENANYALDYAVALAGVMDAEIIVFHAYSIVLFNADMPYNVIEQELNTLKHISILKLEETCQLIRKKNPAIHSSYIIKQGFPGNLIIELAKEKGVDMIVMGTQGAGAVKSFFIGSNASDVIEKAPCPVFAIPDKVPYHGINHIVYASDYYDSDIKDLGVLASIAEAFKAEISIVNVSDEGHEVQNAVSDMFMKDLRAKVNYPHINLTLIEGNNVVKGLEEYIRENPTDMLVTSTKRRNILEKLMERSLTKQLAYHAVIPLLAFHQKVTF